MPTDDLDHIADNAAIYSVIDPFVTRVVGAVRPLFAERGNRAPESIGTGVLFRANDSCLVLTAGHVLQAFGNEPIQIPGETRNLAAPGESRRTRPKPGQASDPFDAAVLRVDDGYLDELIGHALSLDDLDTSDCYDTGTNYLLLGFRERDMIFDASQRRVNRSPFRYVAALADLETYTQLAITPATHVAIQYDPERTVSQKGIGVAPKPRGVSGGGIWHVPQTFDPGLAHASKLVAIFTDAHRREGALVGTRVNCHLALIRRSWPDVLQ